MPITLGCPACGQRFRARDESVGKRVKCPFCESAVDVPSPREIADVVNAPSLRQLADDATPYRDGIARLSHVHHWQQEAVVECLLFLAPVGERLAEARIRQLMNGVDVEETGLSRVLEQLLQAGRISRDNSSRHYYLPRSRRAYLEKSFSGPPENRAATPVTVIPPTLSKPHRRWLRVAIRALVVAILTGVGSQVGGWAGGIITATLTSLAAVFLGETGTHTDGV